MLMLPVRAATHHRFNRSKSSSALASSMPSARKEVNCQTITQKPMSSPAGTRTTPQTGVRARTRPVNIARRIRATRLGVGTQSATSRDQTTTIRLRASRNTAAQPSAGPGVAKEGPCPADYLLQADAGSPCRRAALADGGHGRSSNSADWLFPR